MTTRLPATAATGPRRQRGVALLVALILLIGVTLLSVAAVSTSVMELRMAGNSELAATTYQRTLAAVDYVVADSTNLPATGPLNELNAVALAGDPFQLTGGDSISAFAARTADCAAPPRMRNASSMKAYSAFNFEVSALAEQDASGAGRAGVRQGYVLLGPKC